MNGRAREKVVTSSRVHAMRYVQAYQWYIAEQGYNDVRV